MRRRQIVQQRGDGGIDRGAEGSLLPALKAQMRALMQRIHEISAAQAPIWDARVPSFDNGEPRCRHCREVQHPKGLASHERWCDDNPNRGKSR